MRNRFILYIGITIILLRISWTDLRERRIGKIESAMLIFGGLAEQFFAADKMFSIEALLFTDALIGGFLCAGISEFVNLIFSNLRGFGGGDIRLMFAAGWLLGYDRGLCAMFAGGIAALIVSGFYGIWKKESIIHLEIPFGPFLAWGIIVVLWISL